MIAIDPGFSNMGWAILTVGRGGAFVDGVGLIQTHKESGPVYLDDLRRTKWLARELKAVNVHADFVDMHADFVVAEAKSGSKSAKAATHMAMAQTVVACTFPSVRLIQAGRVKSLLTGDRRASKDTIKEYVLSEHPYTENMIIESVGKSKARQEHIYDAIAIGLASLKDINEIK